MSFTTETASKQKSGWPELQREIGSLTTSQLFSEDRVETTAGVRATVSYYNETSVEVEPSTFFSARREESTDIFELWSGGAFFMVQKQPRSFTVKKAPPLRSVGCRLAGSDLRGEPFPL